MVKYAGGQSALLSVNRLPAGGEVTVDLRLVGNNDEGQIGSPVFLRCIMHAPIEVPDVVGGIAALTAIANNWMPDPPSITKHPRVRIVS